ncbi:MAG: hypothetical protein J1E96_06130 [Ruminococcus sp.]|nr:hypothetical protein [Ruminococcus sp.]
MAFLDSVKIGLSTAVDTVSGITQTLVEKNRVNAQLNRLRTIMKNECEMINRAYITLGKKYYENKMNNKTEACDNEEELFKIIENSKEQIRKARERYRKIVEMQTVESESKYNVEELEDITVACSNESEYEEIPFKAEEKLEEAEPCEADDETEVADEDTF